MNREEFEKVISKLDRKKYVIYIANENINYEFKIKEWAILDKYTFLNEYLDHKELCVLGSYKNSTLEEIQKLIEEDTDE